MAPGPFTVNADGRGIAASVAVKVTADQTQTVESGFQCGSTPGNCAGLPIELGGPGDQVFVLLFGTGIRGRSALSAVTALIGGQAVSVVFAGPQGGDVGLDQINIGPLPRTLAGKGPMNLLLTVDGNLANTVTLHFK